MDQSAMIGIEAALAPQAAARLDIYGGVHKGLRMFMADTLVRVGSADPADRAGLDGVLGQVRSMLEILRHHLRHENEFVHPAIEARRPGAARFTADDHVQHEAAIAALEAEAAALGATGAAGATGAHAPDALPHALYGFYLRLSRFVAENFEHMLVEETHNTAVLREAYDDAEIGALLQRLILSIDPAATAVFHRWMVPAMSHPERVGMLGAMQAMAPAPVFEAEMANARQVLPAREYDALARALGFGARAG